MSKKGLPIGVEAASLTSESTILCCPRARYDLYMYSSLSACSACGMRFRLPASLIASWKLPSQNKLRRVYNSSGSDIYKSYLCHLPYDRSSSFDVMKCYTMYFIWYTPRGWNDISYITHMLWYTQRFIIASVSAVRLTTPPFRCTGGPLC